jgi:nitroreductase
MNMKTFKNMLMGAGLLMLGSCVQPTVNVEPAPVNKADIVIENIMSRVSVRSFTNEPVSREDLQTLIKVGIQAPSANNRQDWEVRVIDNQQTLNEISDLVKKSESGAQLAARVGDKTIFSNAPAVFFIAQEKDAPYSGVDTGLLSENIMLAANAMGLGTCYQAGTVRAMTSVPEAVEYLKKLGFSENYELLNIILVGHPAENPAVKDRDASKAKFVE